MASEQEAVTRRRQKVWADLTFLEQAVERSRQMLGSVPQHWERARALLWRDLRGMIGQGRPANR